MIKLDIQMFASTNKTANYELPQFVGTDKPTWLSDFNGAMASIDAGMHENATAIESLSSDVDTATSTASQASQDVSNLTTTVGTLSTNVTTATATANNAQSTATSALNTANTANSKANTNATAIGDLSSLSTTDKNSTVDAINEINQHIADMQATILWTNPNPGNDMGNNVSITLSSDDYDLLEVFVLYSKNNQTMSNSFRFPKGKGGMIMVTSAEGTPTIILRNLKYVSDTSLNLTIGKLNQLATNTVSDSTSGCIPLYIVGYKTGLFE